MKDNTRVIEKLLSVAEKRKTLTGLVLIAIALAGFYNLYLKIKPPKPVLTRYLLQEVAKNISPSNFHEKELPTDLWGNKIIISSNEDRLILISKGKDSLINTSDDIIYETEKDTI